MSAGRGELVATDESTVVSKPLLDAVVVEDGQSNGGFPDPSWTDESDWSKAFREVDDLLNQFVASETGPWWRGWRFTRYTRANMRYWIRWWLRSLT